MLQRKATFGLHVLQHFISAQHRAQKMHLLPQAVHRVLQREKVTRRFGPAARSFLLTFQLNFAPPASADSNGFEKAHQREQQESQ